MKQAATSAAMPRGQEHKARLELGLRPYGDGSGFSVTVVFKRLITVEGKESVRHFTMVQGESRVVIGANEWAEIRDAIDGVIPHFYPQEK